MDIVLGPVYSRSWANDFVLAGIGLTVLQAISAGVETREIWRAVCAATEVPSALI